MPRDRLLLPAVLLLVAAGAAAYANSFDGLFVFDDIASIVDNPTIRRLWPPGEALSPPRDWGFTVSGRPVLNFSFALNYAISGLEVWSYHALNLAIHLGAGLTLFGLVRRTLHRMPFATAWADSATPVALAVAALWTLHPLQTESVTYIVQRAESLMGLFFLLTLYAFIRAADSPRPWPWRAVSFAACLLGVGTKEVAALAPLLVLLYDRTFVSGSFRVAWQRHRVAHLALMATWLPLAIWLAQTGGDRGGTVGFDVGISWTAYWATQGEALTRYLGLAFWPHPLVFEYGKVAPASWMETAGWAVLPLTLLIATLIALRRWPAAGFCGAWFFALLAPTSLVPGVNQMIVEHRMYLPLAGLVAFVGVGLWRWARGRSLAVFAGAAALAAILVTAQRNELYADEQRLWENVLARRPANARAHNNLGLLHYRAGRLDVAIAHYRASLRSDPGAALTQHNLGLALMKAGKLEEAQAPLAEAARILPYFVDAQVNLGIVLMNLGRTEEALTHFATALRVNPTQAEAHFRLGVALAQLGRWSDAIAHYAEAVRIDPNRAEAHNNWAVALMRLSSPAEALVHFEAALRLQPALPGAHFNRALAYTATGRPAEALRDYAEAVRLDSAHADAQLNFGIALAQAGNLSGARPHLEAAVRLRPDSAEAHANLGTALLALELPAEAVAAYEAALRLRPDDAKAHYNFGYALLSVGRSADARTHFEHALRLQPDFAAARSMLQRWGPGRAP